MFQSGEIVLYRFDLAQVNDVTTEKKQSYYLLHSLEAEYCEFKVPYENAYGHIRNLPSQTELQKELDGIATLTCITIPRTAGTQFYQKIMNSLLFQDWLALLKTLYQNRKSAYESGRKFNQKQNMYYQLILEKMGSIYAYVFQKSDDESIAVLEHVLDQACALS